MSSISPAVYRGMSLQCQKPGCKAPVPDDLAPHRVCLLHYALLVEEACDDIRRETVRGVPNPERRAEIERYIAESGEKLFRLSTSGSRIPDEVKTRVVSTFLTLINLRENLERAESRRILRES